MGLLDNVPGLLSRNNEALLQTGLGLLSGKTAQEQAALGARGFADARKANMTMKWLQATNPDIAAAVQSGAIDAPSAFKLAYEQKLKAQEPKKPNLMGVGKAIYNADTGQWITPPAEAGGADAPEYGLAPVYGTDAQGRTVLGQLSKDGTFRQTSLPDGFSPTPGISNIDMGTGVRTINNRTGAVISETPKDLSGAESQKVQGKMQGEAAATLPGDLQRAEATVQQIDQLLANPGLDSIVGQADQYRPTWSLGSEGNDALARLKQLQGGAFLQAFGMLKGGGAITEVEGAKAQAAQARMDRAQSEDVFKAALKDFRDAVQAGTEKLKQKAGVGASSRSTGSGVSWSIEN